MNSSLFLLRTIYLFILVTFSNLSEPNLIIEYNHTPSQHKLLFLNGPQAILDWKSWLKKRKKFQEEINPPLTILIKLDFSPVRI